MKKLGMIQSVLFFLIFATVGFSQNNQTQTSPPYDDTYYEDGDYQQSYDDNGSYEVFYDELSPYGSWVNYPQYGYVWIPRVSNDFQPYGTEGHWVMTNYGWTWVSDYRWGWAAFHYGRWAFEPRYGWMWVPGRQWGPAWVSWRESDEYFGWAPLRPFVSISVNISSPYDHYRFVPRRHFTNRNVYNYYADRRNNVTIINHTTIINETHVVNKNKYYYGPRKDYVERSVGQSIRVANVYDNNRPGADVVDNDRVNVYRPRIDKAPQGGVRQAPKKLVAAADLQPISTDRRLTSSVRREKPQNTEGGQLNQPRRNETQQVNPDVNRRQPIPNDVPRTEVRQQRRNETQQVNPDVNRRQPIPNDVPRTEVRQPRRNETQQVNPDVNRRQQIPNDVPRTEVRQPRRNETQRVNPDVNRPQQMPNNEQRSEMRQQRRNETQQVNPDVNRRQPMPNNTPRTEMRQPNAEKINPQPMKDKDNAPHRRNNRENEK